ncbi:hypothetical protein ACGFZK_07600 [Streptomyces sp. NPDC048257]|uniref:hypothetical protein n=1 Tax=Streptomyces sp. NPDC048257 TaxID=3365526 RepID=UPI0037245F68
MGLELAGQRERVGVPAYITVEGGRTQPSECTVLVTADLMEPMWTVNYPEVPSHRLPAEPLPEQPGWKLQLPETGAEPSSTRPNARRWQAAGRRWTHTMQALDALMRTGDDACHDCAAAEVLIQAFELGSGYA